MAKKRKGKLELDWVDKGDIILTKFDENGKTYPASYFQGQVDDEELMPREFELIESVGDPKSENMLIWGENLIALRSLEREFARKIKLIYIDPPFNTGQDFEDYEDGLEHSIWLSMMENRLRSAEKLLRDDGVIFVHISDIEEHHLRILMDEIFDKNNFINRITVKTKSPSGFKTVNIGVFENAEYILLYAKNKDKWQYIPQYVECRYDSNYNKIITNKHDDYKKWNIRNLIEYVAEELGYRDAKEARKKIGKDAFSFQISEYALLNSGRVFRYTEISDTGAGAETVKLKYISKKTAGVILQKREKYHDRYIHQGREISFYENKIRKINRKKIPTTILTNIWDDISWEGIANEGEVKLKQGKKPERLIKRLIEMSLNANDDYYALDFFAGSGTTGAVAHKMGRKWIMVEIREDMVNEKALKRMKNVVNGDSTGISKEVGWKGGGGFKFYKLGEPLIVKHKKYPSIKIINPKYYNTALIKVICKLEGFKFRKQDKLLQGVNKLGNKYAHITEQYVSQGYIDLLKSKLAENEEIVIYCFNYDEKVALPLNIIIKKLPADISKPYQMRLKI